MKMRRVTIALMVACCLLMAGCHSSRKQLVEPERNSHAKAESKAGTSKLGQKLVDEARRWLGTRYRYGGQTKGKGTDCSGMVMVVYKDVAGIKLPRSSAEQQAFTKRIKRKGLIAGDLVFFSSKAGGGRVGHVGIYVGDGRFIHASSSKGVIISSLDEPYYIRHYHSAGRVPGIEKTIVKTRGARPEPKLEMPRQSNAKPDTVLEITLDEFEKLIKVSPDTIPGQIEEPTGDDITTDTITSAVIKAFDN